MDDDGDPQTIISCPRDPSHIFPRFRLSRHLVKCEKQPKKEPKKMEKCPFNCVHVVHLNDYEDHIAGCPDGDSFYASTYQMDDPQNKLVEELNENTKIHVDICTETGENWDEEIDMERDVISDSRKNAEDRGALQSNSNEPPAVRKALKAEQRARARERINMEEERSRMAPNNR